MTFATRLAAPAAAALLLAAAVPASAAFFTAGTAPYSGANGCSGVQGGNGQAPIYASASCSQSVNQRTAAEAYADYGQVGASAQALGGSSASASSSFQDLVRFTSANPADAFATVVVQFELDGFLTADAGAPTVDVPAPSATADVRAALYFNGQGAFTFERTDTSNSSGSHVLVDNQAFSVASGDPYGAGLSLVLTRSFFVPLNTNITYAFALTSSASVFGPNAAASSMFFHTMGLVGGADAFILPPGVTANAGDYLVDNRFGGAAGGVPEPAGWALMITGLGLAGGGLRGRRPRLAA